jgi:hypothetical protein
LKPPDYVSTNGPKYIFKGSDLIVLLIEVHWHPHLKLVPADIDGGTAVIGGAHPEVPLHSDFFTRGLH